MTTLPAAAEFTDPSTTEAEFKTAITDLRTFLADLLGTAGTQSAAQAAMQVLLGSGITSKSTTYTLTAADRGKVVSCTGTWTLSLLSAATAGNGFCFAIKNNGSGTITIAPNGTDTIDSASLAAGNSKIYVCTGSGWYSFGGNTVTLEDLGGMSINMTAEAVGSLTIVGTTTSGQYTMGTSYTLSGKSGTWKALTGTVRSGKSITSWGTTDYYITLFQRTA